LVESWADKSKKNKVAAVAISSFRNIVFTFLGVKERAQPA